MFGGLRSEANIDPFTILALARGAVSAIKQGCELYNQFKGEVTEAKATIDQARSIVKEVGGFFGFFKRKAKVHVVNEPTQTSKSKSPAFDELEVRKSISDNLVQFFKALEQLKTHIREEEEKSQSIYDPDQNMMEAALHRVLAMDEMEKLQYEIRQLMVYQTPGMGDLYTRVIRMVGVISEEQEVARLNKEREDRDRKWRHRMAKERLKDRFLIAGAVILGVGYLILMFSLLVLDRQMRYGF